jgi:hypothetical protein
MHKNKWKICIENHISYIKLSEKTRAKYYKETDKIPKKYIKQGIVFKNGVAHYIDNDEKVVKNSKKAGLPNMMKINGQDIWSGLNPHIRNKIASQMHEFYTKHVKEQIIDKGTNFIQIADNQRLIVLFHFYDDLVQIQDIDNNAFIFVKTFLDTITTKRSNKTDDHIKLGLIKDDSPKYIKGIYYDFTESSTRKLEIELVLVDKNYKITI